MIGLRLPYFKRNVKNRSIVIGVIEQRGWIKLGLRDGWVKFGKNDIEPKKNHSNLHRSRQQKNMFHNTDNKYVTEIKILCSKSETFSTSDSFHLILDAHRIHWDLRIIIPTKKPHNSQEHDHKFTRQWKHGMKNILRFRYLSATLKCIATTPHTLFWNHWRRFRQNPYPKIDKLA